MLGFFPLCLPDNRHIHGCSVMAMAAAVRRLQVVAIVVPAHLKRRIVRDIPLLTSVDLHAAQVADAAVAVEDVHALAG
jgi:hypothetical protein